jgi:hypothetical protein
MAKRRVYVKKSGKIKTRKVAGLKKGSNAKRTGRRATGAFADG